MSRIFRALALLTLVASCGSANYSAPRNLDDACSIVSQRPNYLNAMKATEQLSGLEMMAVDPVRRVLAPRMVAGLISMPLLAAVFSMLGVLGGWFVGVGLLGVDDGTYWAQMQAKIDWNEDVINGVIKSVVFGFACTWIAIFQGYDCVPTSEGVSRATTRTVVHSALAVLGLDFVLTALMFGD